MKTFLLTAIFGLISFSVVHSQKKFTNPERASQLKDQYEDNSVVAYSSATDYVFKNNDLALTVNQKDDIKLISLKSNVKYRRPVFYNDHIELKSGSAKYASGRGILQNNKVCGNYEIEDIFYSDAKVCSYYFDILYEASEIAFSSEREYDDPKYLTKVFFHDQEPALHRKISFTIPKGVDVELVEMNFEGFDIDIDVSQTDLGTVHKYVVEDISELKTEENMEGYLNQYPHILVLTKSYETSEGKKNVLSKVDDLYQWYRTLVKDVIVDKSALQGEVDKLISGAASDEEKIKNIYYWVQENIKYLAFENGLAAFTPEAPQKVYNNKYGDCKGMAMLTKTMLQMAGFDARMTWIGTNMIPYTYDYPSLAVDNHMICTVFLNDRQYILDATEKYIALGEHGERIQGQEMLIEDGDQFIRKTVPIESSDKNLISRSEKLKVDGETLVGEGQLEIKGEAKKTILYISTNSRVDEKDKLYDMLSVSNHGNTDVIKINNVPETEREQPLNIKYDYQLQNKVSSFDNELFIDIDWDKNYKNLEIEDDRFSDYYFGRKVHNKVVKTLEVPGNYKIKHVPDALDEKYKDIKVKVSFEVKGQKIIYTNEIIIESGKIAKEDFSEWNAIQKKLNEVYEDQIVITKVL
jgi:transglutaminase-like putative cysteine protease